MPNAIQCCFSREHWVIANIHSMKWSTNKTIIQHDHVWEDNIIIIVIFIAIITIVITIILPLESTILEIYYLRLLGKAGYMQTQQPVHNGNKRKGVILEKKIYNSKNVDMNFFPQLAVLAFWCRQSHTIQIWIYAKAVRIVIVSASMTTRCNALAYINVL